MLLVKEKICDQNNPKKVGIKLLPFNFQESLYLKGSLHIQQHIQHITYSYKTFSSAFIIPA